MGLVNMGKPLAALVLGLALMSSHTVEGSWSEWSTFSICSTTCGAGWKTKTRTCTPSISAYGTTTCSGVKEVTVACNEDVPCPVDGDWGQWTSYGECSSSCVGGTKTRSRLCNYPSPAYGGADCTGFASESVDCNKDVPCPVDGAWGQWTSYGECSSSCVGGTKTRSRLCNYPSPAYGGADCAGFASESVDCNKDVPCPVDGAWGQWTSYGECSSSCVGGTKTRSRLCNYPSPAYGGADCTGFASESVDCNKDVPCPVDGAWGQWTSYGECSSSCVGGTKTRSRLCNYPSPAYGGADCTGFASESVDCNKDVPCPVDGAWGQWTSYGECSSSCVGGTKTRSRLCNYPSPAYGGADCAGFASESVDCNKDVPCPVDGAWSQWTSYGECSSSCVGGTKTRSRLCNYPSPAYGGTDCAGFASESVDCNKDVPCPVDGAWGQWTSYGECSSSCVGGTKTRSRLCNYPSPAYGGADCAGFASESVDCNKDVPCPVDGAWGQWTSYGECSSSCVGGTKTRSRLCNYPSPAYGGADCAGFASESVDCNKDVPCPVDGAWGQWTSYGECSSSCVGGTKTRSRLCNYPSPAYGGTDCAGFASESVDCNKDVHCAVDGDWTEWTYWASCSNTCGHGQNTRSRTCSSPSPAYGGAQCSGVDAEYRDCKHRNPCPVNGGWADWSEWTVCAGSCGHGRQTRLRTCTNPTPRFGGAKCEGKFMAHRSCDNTHLSHCTTPSYPKYY